MTCVEGGMSHLVSAKDGCSVAALLWKWVCVSHIGGGVAAPHTHTPVPLTTTKRELLDHKPFKAEKASPQKSYLAKRTPHEPYSRNSIFNV